MNKNLLKTNPNDSAFASAATTPQGDFLGESGLTKREYFAGLIMANLVPAIIGIAYEQKAKEAVECADFLIAALNEVKQ